MKINVGSKNPIKAQAVREAFLEFFDNVKVNPVNVESGVSKQPTSLGEIVNGAKNRAVSCFDNCDYSVGLEAGVFPVLGTLTGYMDVGCCIIYDGEIRGVGFSPGFEYPKVIIQEVLKGREVGNVSDELFNETDSKQKQGTVGILSRGKILRKDFMKYGVMMALIPLLNKGLY